jgi:NAD(P)-dependent dehydrogenase (short-subunit alcohol dehydrogenase family)
VVVTGRDRAALGAWTSADSQRCLVLQLDVTVQEQIDAAVGAALQHFGRIDVLVNNAGYGYQATAEEGEDAAIRAMFDTNVHGVFALTRAVLPHMRAQRSGYIMNITSVAGLVGLPGSGFYAASKHAVEGWSDALLAEVGPLGIRVTCIEPGPFRTAFAGRSIRQTPGRIADYDATANARLKGTVESSGKQSGDPVQAARLMLELADHPRPPRHLVLGRFGVATVLGALQSRLDEIAAWRHTGEATDFPSST